MKVFKKIISVSLACISAFSYLSMAVSASDKSYTIENPYSEVIWEGENAWGAYKGNLHTHSTVSDAEVDYRDMILAHYEQGFDFLAMTDHAVTGKSWNKKPNALPLYLYQAFLGKYPTYFNDEEFAALQDGTYEVNGVERGRGMTCVTGGNELNGLTITKDHVNALFLPETAGNNYLGFENDYEGAVRLADHYGALSFINHPGDWLNSNADRANCSDPEKIAYFGDILLRYDSCLGVEVFNEHNGPTGYDRDTWDNLLMYCLPYGKNIIGFSNGDTHYLEDVDSSFNIYMMEENNLKNIKKTMQSGASFMVTRCIRADVDKFGPAEKLDVRGTDIPYPSFTDIKVDGHKVTVKFNEAYNLKWVANGEVIDSKDFEQGADNQSYTIDLDQIENSDEFLYIRAQLLGEGGVTLTQAFVIDDGSEPLEYVRDNSFKALLQRFLRQILSLRIFVLIKKIF